MIVYFRVLFFQNELSVLEFIHTIVETFDRYFESVVSLLNMNVGVTVNAKL